MKGRHGSFHFLLTCAVLVGIVPTFADAPPVIPIEQVVQDQPIFHRSSYNYAPAVIRDGALYHLYWCGGVAGDFILHAQATKPEGPWHASTGTVPFSFDVALKPTRSASDFDGLHTCDPNVLKIGGRFYLYYGGAASEGSLTAIGVAASRDGVHFDRLNGGRPIVVPAKTNPGFAAAHLTYGAGQPAAAYVPPYVYLSFTDSTGAGVNKGNGAGQFVLRSKDPTFASGIEELTATGWQPRKPGQHTAEFSYLESFGLDWAYDPRTRTILAVSDRTAGHTSIFVLDPETLKLRATGDLALKWREGPSLIAEADKSLAPRTACDKLPLAVVAAEGASASPWSWNEFGLSSGTLAFPMLCSR